MRVVILGLDGAGKTSILSAMRGITLSGPPIPTIGFNVENLEYKNLVFTLWDVGGQQKFRPLWKHYYHNTQAVIFVVDASDRCRFKEAQNELSKIVNERELKDALFLIYANKQVRQNYLYLYICITQMIVNKLINLINFSNYFFFLLFIIYSCFFSYYHFFIL